jgi:Tfp pilus assembly protein PilO
MSDLKNGNGSGTGTAPAALEQSGRSPRFSLRSLLRFRLDPRRDALKICAVLGALLLLNLVFTLAVLRPRSNRVRSLEVEKATFDQTYRRAETQARLAAESYERASQVQQQLEEFYGVMMSTARDRLGRTQAEILRIGEKFDTLPDPLQLNPKDLEEQEVQLLTISFPLQGGYENLRGFVNEMERSSQLLIIDQINMAENRAGAGGLRLNIDVTTYFDAPHLKELTASRGPGSRGARRR